MSKSSSRGYWEPFSNTAFADGDCVSARRAWLVKNNISHLVDEYTQHRINWCADQGVDTDSEGRSFADLTGNDEPRWYAQMFPLTSVTPEKPVNLDIEVYGRSSQHTSSGVYMKAQIVPYSQPVGRGDVTYWETAATVSTTTSIVQVLISTQVFLTVTTFPGYPSLRGKWSVVENGERHHPFIHMARFECAVWTTHADARGTIESVLVREFV